MFDNFYCNLLKKKKNCSNKCTFSEHLSCKCHAYEYGIWMYHCTVFVRSAAESLFYWQWLSSSAGSIIYRFAQVDNAMRSFWRHTLIAALWFETLWEPLIKLSVPLFGCEPTFCSQAAADWFIIMSITFVLVHQELK